MRSNLLLLGLLVLAVLLLISPWVLPTSLAAPLHQAGIGPVIIVSNEGQYPGNAVDLTLVRNASGDPDPAWRERFFNAAGWQNAYPSMRASAWTGGSNIDPLLNQGADHIWGGAPGSPLQPDAGNFTQYTNRSAGGNYSNGRAIPTDPRPQYLFLRKEFCMPINAQANAQRRLTTGGGTLSLLNATDSASVLDGAASVSMNMVNLGVVPGNESNAVADLPVLPNFLYRGRNALAIRAADARSDERAALLYSAALDYALDPNALQIGFTPANPLVGDLISFSATDDGLSDRPPYAYGWEFGDGGTSNQQNPTHAYAVAGTYAVTLTVTDADGCPGIVATSVVVQGAALVVDKSAVPSNLVYTGENLYYQIDVSNIGATPLAGVVVTDAVPPNTTYVPGSCSGGLSCAEAGGVVQWDLGDLGPGAAVTLGFFVRVEPAAAGATLVNTAYAWSGAISASDSVAVPVVQGCVALDGVLITGPATGLTGVAYGFTAGYTPANASLPINYSWDNGDTTATSNRTFAAPGLYTLVVTATNACSLVTDSHTIDITAACVPVTGVTLNQLTANPVVGAPVDFSADVQPAGATPDFSYRITVDGVPGAVMSATTSPINFSQTFATAGAHTVQIAVWNCAMTEAEAVTDVLQVDVGQGCVALTGVTIAGPATGQTGTTYNFTANYTPNTATAPAFLWDNGDATQVSSRAFATPGTYLLSVTVSNACSSVAAAHSIVVSSPAPTSPPPPPPTAQPTQAATGLPTPAFLPVSGQGVGGTSWPLAALSLALLLGLSLALMIKLPGRTRPS